MQTLMPAPVIKLKIDGMELDSGSGGVFDQRNPYSGELQARVLLAGKNEVDAAVELAANKAEEWRRHPPERRRDILFAMAKLLEEHREEFSRLAALDGGLPLKWGRIIADLAIGNFKYFAGWCDKISGELISTVDTRGALTYTQPEPYGVVGAIITWNGPLNSLAMKIAPALAAGNCVVAKPSEFTPFAPELFARLLVQAGLPAGVCTVLNGAVEAGEALVRHPKVELVSFTGGPQTARTILVACAEQMKPAIMELGGKSASIVFDDVNDIESVCHVAVDMTIGALAGQGCTVPSRLLVHEKIYDRVVERVTEIAATFKLGDPMQPDVQVGPLINAAACDRVVGMLERAKAEGAGRFTLGGGRPGGALADKNFVEPTVIADVNPLHEIAQTEVFGPVLVIMRFSNEEEAIAIANSTQYGLATYLQTGNIDRIHRMTERLRSGGVYANGDMMPAMPHRPFGGLGLSGYGKEGGRAGIDAFLRYKTVAIA